MNEHIKVKNCPQCGAPVKFTKNKCEYCDAEFLVLSITYLDNFDKTGINKYINHYKQLLKNSPDDGEINCAMGICYLDLGLYDLASKYFFKAIEYIPDYGDVYYYYAISLLKGKKPRVLNLTEIKKIEEYLNTAIQLDDSKVKYYYLWVLIKYDFYIRNGLRTGSPTFEDLICQLDKKQFEKVEIENILKRIPIDDPNLLKILKS